MQLDLSRYPFFSEHKKETLTLLPDQGFSNKNYSFQFQDRTYLLRKFILQDIDRELEYQIQTLVYEKGISAKPFLLDCEKGFMICEFLEGEHRHTPSKEELKQIVEALKKLHTIRIENKPIALKGLFSVQNKAVREAFTILEKYPNTLVLCHNDLNPKNILFSDHSVKFIDWEFAGMNDLYFDLAAMSVEFNLSVVDEAYFLASYFQKEGWEKENLDAYKVIYRALCKQWFEENT